MNLDAIAKLIDLCRAKGVLVMTHSDLDGASVSFQLGPMPFDPAAKNPDGSPKVESHEDRIERELFETGA